MHEKKEKETCPIATADKRHTELWLEFQAGERLFLSLAIAMQRRNEATQLPAGCLKVHPSCVPLLSRYLRAMLCSSSYFISLAKRSHH